MAKREENYTRVPNIMLDDTTLNVYEFRIMAHIARQTIGYGKKSDGISLSQFHKVTGISVAKVHTTITELKKKKYIKVTQQTAKSGGKSYNRYSLTLIHNMDNHIHDMDNPIPQHGEPLIHDMDIQKKIEQKKIDKREEREITSNNIYFSIFGNELKKEIHNFTKEQSIGASNQSAYKAKLKRQLEKNHQETLENFEEWYLDSKCGELSSKYEGKYFKDEPIVSIHNYTDTEGFSDSAKFIIQVKEDSGKDRTYSYENYHEIEEDLKTFICDEEL